MSNETLSSHVTRMASLRDQNAEYLRGYREGQEAAAKELAALVDTLMRRFNNVGMYPTWLDNHQPGEVV